MENPSERSVLSDERTNTSILILPEPERRLGH